MGAVGGILGQILGHILPFKMGGKVKKIRKGKVGRPKKAKKSNRKK